MIDVAGAWRRTAKHVGLFAVYSTIISFCFLTPAQADTKAKVLTISESKTLVRQIEQHWNVPIGASEALNAVIHIHIDVNPDRTVQHAVIIDSDNISSNPYYRAVAESALRAVYASSPLELPEDKYEQWKSIDISLSAKDML